MAEARAIRVRGAVQGVGFRPHVWRLARDLALKGCVANDGEGVLITAWGSAPALDAFAHALVAEAPPLARIDAVEQAPLTGPAPPAFTIAASQAGPVRTAIVPDAATCPACLAETRDPANRRYGHDFANCTHCGPRLSIITAVPYDRAHTAMAGFAMCPACAGEYADPADRRYHAQPTCCPACGPQLWIEPAGGLGDPLAEAARRLNAGQIVAIKGLGGFHLAVRADDGAAVARLRQRKARDAKPFAVMAADVAMIAGWVEVDAAALALLESAAAPIVLLPRRADAPALPAALAPDQDRLGVMLAYTPLHHRLLALVGAPLVMTSGNRSDAPQVTDNDAARAVLGPMADAIVLHDRAIINRLDDSVVADGMVLRRARGYAPAPIVLPSAFAGAPPVLAMGGALKATFCLLRDGEAVLSQHIGDLEQAEALADYRAMLDLFARIYDFTPAVIAIDAHPDYLSARLGEAMARATGARLVRVGHHHAHFAACLADNGVAPGVGVAAGAGVAAADGALGLVLDGLGMGEDGSLWGGEWLAGGYGAAVRVGHVPAVALPGGAAAMREPWRNLLAQLMAAFGADWREAAGAVAWPPGAPVEQVAAMIERAVASPLCSSAGRWFDALAAALGVHGARISHEGQAAMAVEALARPYWRAAAAYPVDPAAGWAPLWRALLADRAAGVAPGLIAARAQRAFVAQLVALAPGHEMAGRVVALSGGVMHNALVAEGLRQALGDRGACVLTHRQVPANDGGLSLGQAVIAACKAKGDMQ